MFSYTIDNELELQLVHPSFAPKINALAAAHREYLSQWLAWPPHCTEEKHFAQFIEQSLKDYAERKSMVCSIFYKGELVGNISFNSISKPLQKAEIGYWLAQDKQGLGIMRRAVAAMCKIAFGSLNMEVVKIAAATGNKPSRGVAESLGFRHEGTLSNSENLNGRIVAHEIYALDRKTWLAKQ